MPLSTHLGASDLTAFRNGTLPPQQLLLASRHLSGCEECQMRLQQWHTAPGVPGLMAGIGAVEHLSYEEILALVEATAAREELVRAEGHLRFCPQCAAEFEDLRSFEARVEEDWRVAARAEPARARPPLLRMLQFVMAPGALRLAAACALVIVVLLFWRSPQGRTGGTVALVDRLTEISSGAAGRFWVGLSLIVVGVFAALAHARARRRAGGRRGSSGKDGANQKREE